MNGIIYQKQDNFRIFYKLPILYYPKTEDLGGEPWILTWPSVYAEKKLKSGIRVSLGTGLVAAACVHSLLGKGEIEEGEGFMGGPPVILVLGLKYKF